MPRAKRQRNKGTAPSTPTRPYSPRRSVFDIERTFTARMTTQRKLEALRREVKKRALNEIVDEYIYCANYSTTAARLNDFDNARAREVAAAERMRAKHRVISERAPLQRHLEQLRQRERELCEQIEELDEANSDLSDDYADALAEKETFRRGELAAQNRITALQAQVTAVQTQQARAAPPTNSTQQVSADQRELRHLREYKELQKQLIEQLEANAVDDEATISNLRVQVTVLQARLAASTAPRV